MPSSSSCWLSLVTSLLIPNYNNKKPVWEKSNGENEENSIGFKMQLTGEWRDGQVGVMTCSARHDRRVAVREGELQTDDE